MANNPTLMSRKNLGPDTIDVFHGEEVITPFADFDDLESPKISRWLQEQATMAQRQIDKQDYNKSLKNLTAIGSGNRLRPILTTKLFDYEIYQGTHENKAVLYANDKINKTHIIIYDPNSSGGEAIDSEYISASPTGRYIVFAVSRHDNPEIKNITLYDSQNSLVICQVKLPTVCPQIAWHPDELGFYYCVARKLFMETENPAPDGTYWCPVKPSDEEDQCVYAYDSGKGHAALPYITENGQYLCIKLLNFSTNKSGLLFSRLAGELDFSQLLSEEEAIINAIGGSQSQIYFETDYKSDLGRVINIDLKNPARNNWQEVYAPDDGRLVMSSHAFQSKTTAVRNEHLAITLESEGKNFIQVWDKNQSEMQKIELPERSVITHITKSLDSPFFKIRAEGFLSPYKEYTLDPKTGHLLADKTKLPISEQNFVTEWIYCAGEDGVKIPVTVIKRKGVRISDGGPIMLKSYGGFGQSLLPEFDPEIVFWINKGWTYAIAHVRGGGEFGAVWHEAGRTINKENTFQDLITVARWFKANNGQNSAKIVAKGESNGGLTVAASVMKNPSLFSAAIMEIPLLDALALGKSDWGKALAAEYGNPFDSQEVFNIMRNYSPLHNISKTQVYPPMLIVTAGNDNSALRAGAYRFVEALQARNKTNQIVVLKELDHVGHIGWPKDTLLDALAYEQAFLSQALALGAFHKIKK